MAVSQGKPKKKGRHVSGEIHPMFRPLSTLNSIEVGFGDAKHFATVTIKSCLFCAASSRLEDAQPYDYASCVVHYNLCPSCRRERTRLLRNKDHGAAFFNLRVGERVSEILDASMDQIKRSAQLFRGLRRQ